MTDGSVRGTTVPCTIDLESTQDHFHAHVSLVGIEVGPGDAVLVHGTPTHIGYGEVRTYDSQAVVDKAGLIRRAWTRLVGRFGFQDLYDVGFEG